MKTVPSEGVCPMMGPLEYVVVGFEGANCTREVVRQIDDLISDGVIRIIDLLFVSKDKRGETRFREVSELSDDEAAALGMIDDPSGELEHLGWFSEDDMAAIAAQLVTDTSAVVMLFEHVWAARLRTTVIAAGGFFLIEGRVPSDVVDEVEALVVSVDH
jgi:Family of unknown function (DUF6325)